MNRESSRLALAGMFISIARRFPGRAAAIAWWAVTGKRVRARNRLREAMAETLAPYRYWVDWIETETDSIDALRNLVQGMQHKPTIAVVALGDRANVGWLVRLIGVLQNQPYPNWHLLVPSGLATELAAQSIAQGDARIRSVPGTATLHGALFDTNAEIVFPLDPDVVPALCALARIADASDGQAMVFGDEDRLDPTGERHDAWFKPEWNAELALAQDFLSGACAFDRLQALDALPEEADLSGGTIYRLAMHVARACPGSIRHIPHVISHRLAPRGDHGRLACVAALVAPQGGQAVRTDRGLIAIDWPLPDPRPLVSLIIPTRDKLELLEPCLSSVRDLTDYGPYEILVMDNGSSEPDTLAYLAALNSDDRVRVITHDEPFNFSAINNRGAALGRGDYICLLNNDTLVLSPDWLTLMMRHAVRPNVGAVGPKLLYADHTIQHAGIAIGLGNAAGHSHRLQPDQATGYHDIAHCTHFVSAVTGACLLVSKRKFVDVGGLDREHLAVAYNDVDLCLKLQQKGWRNIYEPRARLFHLESKSRGSDFSPANYARYQRELAVFQARWDTTRAIDPVHHRSLDRSSETFRVMI